MERRNPIIVIVDDDDDDRLLLKMAFEECQKDMTIHLMEDGEELFDYLHRRGSRSHVNPGNGDLPDLIILDLYLPKKDGFEVIREIKADPELKKIPVLAHTDFCADENVKRCYDLGVNSVILKQSSYDELAQTARSIYNYWIKTIEG